MHTKVLTVVGARPQFIKAAAVSRVLRSTSGMSEVLIHTGQHYDDAMSDVFFRELQIPPPEHHLGIGSASHGAQTGRMLEAIETVIQAERPAWVLIYGDTNSTLAGALAAAKLHVPVAHVEAGLRSFNKRMPEEINRVLADHVSSLLFAPTRDAVDHLGREGISGDKVQLVGDVMYDAALFFKQRAADGSRILERLGLAPKSYLLGTIHRAENTDDPKRLRAIFEGLGQISRQVPVVLPLHPRTRKIIEQDQSLATTGDIRIIEPVGYLDMVMLEQAARLVVTDSGGVQKEAFFYRVPCVTLRDETEWVELVKLGWNRVVPPLSAKAVFEGIQAGLGTEGLPGEPYGKGDAAQRIVASLQREESAESSAAASPSDTR